MFIFSNLFGVYVFDGSLKVVDELHFKNANDFKERDSFIERFRLKHKDALEPDEKSLSKILEHFKDKKFNKDFHLRNVDISRANVKDSVNRDLLISHAVNSHDELERVTNSLVKRLREWYEIYNPEISASIEDHNKFVETILGSDKNEILKELKIKHEDSLGADLKEEDVKQILSLAKKISDVYEEKDDLIDYISRLTDELCPNIKAVCGTLIAGKLLEHTGSLKRLSEMPASTIQILGAETALFRHLKTGARPPRHGLIVNHPFISKAPERLHGKIARALADKISIAAKVDYFKGEFIGDKLNKQLEEKLGRMK